MIKLIKNLRTVSQHMRYRQGVRFPPDYSGSSSLYIPKHVMNIDYIATDITKLGY